MKTNPGGQIAPSDVVGRDQLIDRLWQILERQSLVLTAERRMGKTSVIKKMEATPQAGKLVIYRDLEGVRSPLEFVEIVLSDVETYLSRLQRTAAKARELLQQIGGLEFKGMKIPAIAAPHWKNVLTKTIEDLSEHQDSTLIFLWDELPMMLDNLKQNGGETVAMEVLDVLRSLRQTYPNLRMVFTGSIGLHHVIGSLKQSGYVNSPINDMYSLELPPLLVSDATELARQLLIGENLTVVDLPTLAIEIATSVDCVPYYVHHVIDQLKWENDCSISTLTRLIEANLIDPVNRWDMAHYRDRIDIYYKDNKDLALTLLDILATAEQALSFRELSERLKSQLAIDSDETIKTVLKLLQQDHYVLQQSNRTYRFRFSLIQRYWQFSRELVP